MLQGIDLTPEYMSSFPTVNLYPGKVQQVKEQIRSSLFRQAVFKVQNVEVTFMDECKEMRVIKHIAQTESRSLLGRVLEFQDPSDVKHLREELWTVDRCGADAKYHVRYYREGGDGFSTVVTPTGLKDIWRALQFYYSD